MFATQSSTVSKTETEKGSKVEEKETKFCFFDSDEEILYGPPSVFESDLCLRWNS